MKKVVKKASNPMIGKHVIVRANVAGVHCGTVGWVSGDSKILLKNTRRLWRVYTRDRSGSISDVAANGLKEGADHYIGATVPETLIINPDGFEVAVVTPGAYRSIMEYPVT